MNELIKEISLISDDIVFVGGVSEVLQGVRTETNDIDIVVKSLKGFEKFGEIREFSSNCPYRFGCRRAAINNEYFIDIWVYDELPEYIEVNNIKVETLKSMLNKYEQHIIFLERDYQVNKIKNSISRLKNYINSND